MISYSISKLYQICFFRKKCILGPLSIKKERKHVASRDVAKERKKEK